MSTKKFEDVALIKLDGTMVKIDGTEKKSSFFDFLKLPLDDWDNITFTPEEAIRIKQQLQRLSTGASAAIYLICGGAVVCPFAAKCPYVRAELLRKAVDPSAKGIVPIGSECPVEIQMMDQWSFLYAKEYDIEDGNFTEWGMVRELAEIELMMWRLNNNIAKAQNAELVQENVVGMAPTGDGGTVPITRMEVSAFFDAKERLSNRRAKIVKLMVGDRQEKYKREAALKQQNEDDTSTSAAKLRHHLDKLINEYKAMDLKLSEVEGQVIEVKETTKTLTPDELISIPANDIKSSS